jgi:hypothetical protein
MLENNLLGNRLNAIKQGKTTPEIPTNSNKIYIPAQQPQQSFSLKTFFLSKILVLFDTLLISFLFGYAIKTIFGLDWNLLGICAVGFLLNYFVSVFSKSIVSKTL